MGAHSPCKQLGVLPGDRAVKREECMLRLKGMEATRREIRGVDLRIPCEGRLVDGKHFQIGWPEDWPAASGDRSPQRSHRKSELREAWERPIANPLSAKTGLGEREQ